MKKSLLIFMLILSSISSYANTELKDLREKGILSEEDYMILSEEYKETGKQLFCLMINGEVQHYAFPIYSEGQKIYIPVFNFFKTINFKNYNYDEKNLKLNVELGESLDKRELDFNKKYLIKDYEQTNFTEKDILLRDGDIYLEENLFKKAFLRNLSVSSKYQKLNMTLAFSSPEEIAIRLKNNARLISEENEINEITYTNEKNKLFELGYLRAEVNEIFTKSYETDKKWENDWEADFEYQGSLLYGELTTQYNLRDHRFEDIKLRYDNLYKDHTLEVGNYSVGETSAREWELSFRKDKGYFVTGAKSYVIREDIPIGSRVELIYLGTIIDIQNADNGKVTFTSSEIKEDREYTLKIYDPEGKIYLKTINTTSDYNQQNKGEVEYDFTLREVDDIGRFRFDGNIYYGVTDNLTVGLGYLRDSSLINDKYEYLNKGRAELVYSNTIYSLPYTFRVGGDKVFEDFTYKLNNKSTSDDYSYDFLGQIDIKKLRLKLEQINKGDFYDVKREDSFEARYSLFKGLDLEYEHVRKENYPDLYGVKETERYNRYSVELSKSIKNLLVTAEYEYNTDEKSIYDLNLYYTGFRAMTAKLENKWRNDGKDYEVIFSLFSNGNKYFDYNLEAGYSEEYKDRITFRFSMDYDNWLNFESFMKKDDFNYKVGIDRIVDLRNPTKKIASMESSPVEVTTFIDLNDNNQFDTASGEYGVSKVEVKIGEKVETTDKNGKAKFYGVPNEILYDLNPEIKKPNFLLGNNKIQIKGKNTSTIEAFIPIKPMVSITGIVRIDEVLNLHEYEKMRIFDDILVKIKDINGKVLDMAIPDETGVFEVSGLLPKKYYIEVNYMGIDYQIKGLNEVVQLAYVEKQKDGNVLVFTVNNKKITMRKGDELAYAH